MKLRKTLISIPAQGVWLEGLLCHAPNVRGLVLRLHSTGHPALDGPESALEGELHRHGFATVTLDLLTRQEVHRDPDAAYNIPRLSERIQSTVEWIAHQPPIGALRLGLVAQDTGCAAAVRAVVRDPDRFTALVFLNGRPDLAGAEPLRALRRPVRFIVTPRSPDSAILEKAYALLKGPRHWLALPDGADEREDERLQARAACAWLEQHLGTTESAALE